MRDTEYAREIATAIFPYPDGEARVERIHVKSLAQDEIRFSWWKDGRMAPRPLDLPEEDLLVLLQNGAKGGVFSAGFVTQLAQTLQEIEI